MKRRRKIRRFAVRLLALPLCAGMVLVCGAMLFPENGEKEMDAVPPSAEQSAGPPSAAPQAEDWRLLLVSAVHPLSGDFSVEVEAVEGSCSVDSRVADDLREMLADMRAEGLSPVVCSSYRTRAYQKTLFDRKVQQYLEAGYDTQRAAAEAAMWVAPPDTSEHQTGLAVDIVAASYQILDEKQAETAEQQWLMAHCFEYGFILRYPPDKSALTGIQSEPWHYRYVGREAAADIAAQGLCLEEYLVNHEKTAAQPGAVRRFDV